MVPYTAFGNRFSAIIGSDFSSSAWNFHFGTVSASIFTESVANFVIYFSEIVNLIVLLLFCKDFFFHIHIETEIICEYFIRLICYQRVRTGQRMFLN